MRTPVLVATLGLASACADPTIAIVFQPPTGVALSRVELKYLEPPPAEPFTCDDLAFGYVDQRRLALSIQQSITVEKSGAATALSQLNRTAPKVFWATGFDQNGESVAAGCAELGVVTAATTVTIVGEPTVRVSAVTDTLSVSGRDGGVPPIEVTTAGVSGKALTGIRAQWRALGPNDSGTTGEATSADGRLRYSPGPPPLFGPFLVQTGVRWSTQPPVVTHGLWLPQPQVLEIDGGTEVAMTGQGANAQLAILSPRLFTANAGGQLQLLTFDAQRTARVASADFPTSGLQHIVTVPETGTLLGEGEHGLAGFSRLLYAFNGSTWNAGASIAAAVPLTEGVTLATTIVRPADRACGGAPLLTLSLSKTGTLVGVIRRTIDLTGKLAAQPLDSIDGGLLEAGCISTTPSGEAQGYVVRDNDRTRTLVFDDGGFAGGIFPGLTVGFVVLKPDKQGKRYLTATRVASLGYQLTRNLLSISGDRIAFELEAGVDTGSSAQATGEAGDFDGDGRQDVVSLTQDAEGTRRILVWTQITPNAAQPRVGTAPLPSGCEVAPRVLDIGADGQDDFVLVFQCGDHTRLEVYDLRF